MPSLCEVQSRENVGAIGDGVFSVNLENTGGNYQKLSVRTEGDPPMKRLVRIIVEESNVSFLSRLSRLWVDADRQLGFVGFANEFKGGFGGVDSEISAKRPSH